MSAHKYQKADFLISFFIEWELTESVLIKIKCVYSENIFYWSGRQLKAKTDVEVLQFYCSFV